MDFSIQKAVVSFVRSCVFRFGRRPAIYVYQGRRLCTFRWEACGAAAKNTECTRESRRGYTSSCRRTRRRTPTVAEFDSLICREAKRRFFGSCFLWTWHSREELVPTSVPTFIYVDTTAVDRIPINQSRTPNHSIKSNPHHTAASAIFFFFKFSAQTSAVYTHSTREKVVPGPRDCCRHTYPLPFNGPGCCHKINQSRTTSRFLL